MEYSELIRRDELSKQCIDTSEAPKAIGPYSQAIAYGQLIFTSGQLGIDSATGALKPGVREQAAQALANLEAVLKEARSSMKSVLKTTVFLSDMKDFAAVNEVYASVVPEPFPARSAIQIGQLPMKALVEIEAVAAIEG